MLQATARLLLKLVGWQADFRIPDAPKYVVVGAPHTSNWDFPLGMLAMWASGFRFSWVGKHTLFRGPIGPVMRGLGGIPVDRRGGTGFVKKVIELFAEREALVLAIAPEGTRSYTEHWKGGFYHIAVAARVPIALGYIDYPRKRIGIEAGFTPSGDIVADFAMLEEFYRDKVGRYPDKQGPVRIR